MIDKMIIVEMRTILYAVYFLLKVLKKIDIQTSIDIVAKETIIMLKFFLFTNTMHHCIVQPMVYLLIYMQQVHHMV